MASWIDSLRSRCGPFADAAEEFAALEGVECDPPRGLAGLHAIRRAVGRHRASDALDEEAERRFVEGAGAFLAVLIADHVGKGRHTTEAGRHQLRFGRAAFDPFDGIERVLDAPDADDALALQVALAEGVAHGRRAIVRPRDANWASLRKRVLPRLVGPRFLAEFASARDRPFVAPLVGDLGLALLLRYPGRARFVSQRERARFPADAHRSALDNLARASTSAKLLRVDGDEGSYVVARSADGLDAARLLLPGLHDVLAPELGSPFVAAVPHRDALFACSADVRTSIDALQSRTRLEHDRSRHGISAGLYLVHAHGRLTAYAADPTQPASPRTHDRLDPARRSRRRAR